MFERMYKKRLRAYVRLGYEVVGSSETEGEQGICHIEQRISDGQASSADMFPGGGSLAFESARGVSCTVYALRPK